MEGKVRSTEVSKESLKGLVKGLVKGLPGQGTGQGTTDSRHSADGSALRITPYYHAPQGACTWQAAVVCSTTWSPDQTWEAE